MLTQPRCMSPMIATGGGELSPVNTLTIGLLAALAQHERELISERTKAALAAKKAKGCILGSPQNLTREAILRAAESRRRRAREHPANRQATRACFAIS